MDKEKGRPPLHDHDKYTVRLNRIHAEWAKDQPEGLSGLLRACLKELYTRAREDRLVAEMQQRHPDPNTPASE